MPVVDEPQKPSVKIVARVCAECRGAESSVSSRMLTRLKRGSVQLKGNSVIGTAR